MVLLGAICPRRRGETTPSTTHGTGVQQVGSNQSAREGYDEDEVAYLRNHMRLIWTTCLLAALAAVPAASQSLELGITGGFGSLGDNNLSSLQGGTGPGQTPTGDIVPDLSEIFSLDNGVRIGARMAFNPRVFIGHEFAYSYQHSSLKQLVSSTETDLGSVRSHHAYYNLVLHALPEGYIFRPFVTGGGGFSSFFLPGLSSLSGTGDTKFGYNYGAGLKFNFFTYGLRFDMRNHVTGKPFGRYLPNVNGNLHNLEFSVTFSFLLG